jgi:hypothetical protein
MRKGANSRTLLIEIARRLVGSRIGDARQAYALIRCPAQVVAPSMADCAPAKAVKMLLEGFRVEKKICLIRSFSAIKDRRLKKGNATFYLQTL